MLRKSLLPSHLCSPHLPTADHHHFLPPTPPHHHQDAYVHLPCLWKGRRPLLTPDQRRDRKRGNEVIKIFCWINASIIQKYHLISQQSPALKRRHCHGDQRKTDQPGVHIMPVFLCFPLCSVGQWWTCGRRAAGDVCWAGALGGDQPDTLPLEASSDPPVCQSLSRGKYIFKSTKRKGKICTWKGRKTRRSKHWFKLVIIW